MYIYGHLEYRAILQCNITKKNLVTYVFTVTLKGHKDREFEPVILRQNF